jgi:hypothetical protein
MFATVTNFSMRPVLRVPDREELLMFLHRGLQHLGRQVEEIGADLAHQHDRPFDQPCDFCKKALVLDNLEPLCERHVVGLDPDVIRPLLRIQNDLGAFQLRRIILEGGYRKWLWRHETMAAGCLSGLDPLDRQRDGMRARLVMQDTDNRVQRSHPAEGAFAPTHGLRPGKLPDRPLQHFCNNPGRRPTRPFDHGKPDLSLLVVADLQVFRRQTGRPQEPLQRLFRRVGPWSLALFARGGAFGEKTLDGQCKAPRRGKSAGMRIGEPGLDKAIGHQPLEVGSGPRLHPCRDLLGKEFDQKVGHGAPQSSYFSFS